MQIILQEKKENILLNRQENKGKINFENATPSNNQVSEALAKELKTESALVVIKKINTVYGQLGAVFLAFVYKDAVAKKKAEVVTSYLKKKTEEAQKKAAEAKKEGEQ